MFVGSEDEAMEDRTPEESEDEQVSENYAAKVRIRQLLIFFFFMW